MTEDCVLLSSPKISETIIVIWQNFCFASHSLLLFLQSEWYHCAENFQAAMDVITRCSDSWYSCFLVAGGVAVVFLSVRRLITHVKNSARKRTALGRHYRVIMFSRYPVPGKSKTRLIPLLGERGASTCQLRMVSWYKKNSCFKSPPWTIFQKKINNDDTKYMYQHAHEHVWSS